MYSNMKVLDNLKKYNFISVSLWFINSVWFEVLIYIPMYLGSSNNFLEVEGDQEFIPPWWKPVCWVASGDPNRAWPRFWEIWSMVLVLLLGDHQHVYMSVLGYVYREAITVLFQSRSWMYYLNYMSPILYALFISRLKECF